MSVTPCPHCGTTNRAGSNFCNRCGADLRDEDRSEATAPAIDEEQADVQAARAAPPSAADQGGDTATEERSSAEPTVQTPPAAFSSPEEWPPEDIEATSVTTSVASSSSPPPRRLVTGVQGLLDPLQVASEIRDPEETATQLMATAAPLALDAEHLRRIRALLTEDPVLLDLPLAARRRPPVRLFLPWLMLLLSLAIGLPILLDLSWPVGAPQRWPGVDEAYAAIEALPADATVLVVWAYDPATAAEMDLVALPLASHLLEQRVLPVVVSQLPGGLAVADRLFNRALRGLLADSTLGFTIDPDPFLLAGFLPGGAAVLSLVAREPAAALVEHAPSGLAPRTTPVLPATALARPALTVVIAAQAEEVQDWLEQGQPLQLAPVVAFTSAAADPILRPYLASGQLRGLVTGFDGAVTYQQRRPVHLAATEEAMLLRQLIFQNWGHLVLLCLLLVGNLVAVGRGGTHG
ncbi:MAG: zinc ribbon domain-containing protein [Caldilineaceae bacterium]